MVKNLLFAIQRILEHRLEFKCQASNTTRQKLLSLIDNLFTMKVESKSWQRFEGKLRSLKQYLQLMDLSLKISNSP